MSLRSHASSASQLAVTSEQHTVQTFNPWWSTTDLAQEPLLASKGNQSKLLRWDDLPEWRRDNEFILSDYRPISSSFHKSFLSILSIHNESANIHSHLFGGIIFLALLVYFFKTLPQWSPRAQSKDTLVFSIYFFGVATCFFLSSAYHVTSNHSPKVAAFGNQLDYLGVVLLMWGAAIPTIYYSFWDDPSSARFHWTTTSPLALACASTTLHPRFCTPAFRAYRSIMYASFGLSGLVFVCHGLALYGWDVQRSRMSLVWMLRMGCLNLIGAALYALRISERWYPLRFDIYGASHQIFHFMVVFAGLVHAVGLVLACRYVHGSS